MGKIRFDFTSNAIKQGARKGIEEELKKHLTSLVPQMVNRQAELPTYITMEVGFYTNLMEEARNCYKFELFPAAVSMIGIAAERFAMELSANLNFTINDNQVTEIDLYGREINQYKRLILLFKGKLITEDAYNLLEDIRKIRNKYIHPSEVGNAKEDSLELINKFNEVIQSRFSEKFTFKGGKIVHL